MGKLADVGQPNRRIEATASGIGPQWCSVMRYGDCQATTVWGVFICHCEERSDVAISGVIYNETWGLPRLRLAMTMVYSLDSRLRGNDRRRAQGEGGEG